MSNKDHVLTVEVLDQSGSTFTLREICERGECHAEFVIKLVDYGIIAPLEDYPEARQWEFDVAALSRLRKAQRLQRDLKMNLPAWPCLWNCSMRWRKCVGKWPVSITASGN